ncbi:MAG: ABC transporter ATP-binding protein [Candidatus Omnitrophica bacterium]|nr:ABC transporter ATP-binding protein [Candidatus Omnitrophota bacterium]
MSILSVKNVVKSYGPLKVVDDVSFCLQEGDNLGVIGESGSGKTTLAKIIMGLIKPDKGSIETQRGFLQMVFQDPFQSLDPLWTIEAILKEGLFQAAGMSKEKQYQKMAQMLQAVGLSVDILHRFPHEFSGGERQRIAIARALMANPKVLLLDEAVSSLDTLAQKQIVDLLKKLKQDFHLTLLFISHNLRLVRNFSDKILVMYQGKIIEEGPTNNVLRCPQHPMTRQLLQAAFYL